MKLHGVLEILQRYPEEGALFLKDRGAMTADEIFTFYVPKYSQNEKEKEMEEMIVYNFNQLLHKIERKSFRCITLDFT